VLSPTASSYSMAALTGSTEYDVTLQAIAGTQRSRHVTTVFTTSKEEKLLYSFILQTYLSRTSFPFDVMLHLRSFSLPSSLTFPLFTPLRPLRRYLFNLLFPVGQLYRRPRDCAQIFLNGEASSGLYAAYVNGEERPPIQVYCDMTTDGGGWMVSDSHRLESDS